MIEYNLKNFLERSTDKKSDFLELLKQLPPLDRNGVWIAGGAVRRAIQRTSFTESDIDIFVKSEEIKVGIEKFLLENLGYKEVKRNEINAVFEKDKIKLQLVFFRYYATIEELLDSFDFTICQVATDGISLFCSEYALWDIARKRLALHKLSFGVSTLRRILKYSGQGFTVCSGTLASILEAVIDSPDSIHRDVKYID